MPTIFGSTANSAIIDKMKNKAKIPNVRIILQSNKQIVETEANVPQPSTHIYMTSRLPDLVQPLQCKIDGIKLIFITTTLESHVIHNVFDSRSDKTIDYNIGICRSLLSIQHFSSNMILYWHSLKFMCRLLSLMSVN